MEQTAARLARYVIDGGVSRFTIRAFAGGMFSVLGHNPTFAIRELTGEAGFTPGSLEDAYVQMKIHAGGLAIQDDISDKDKKEIEQTMNQQVLDSARFPEIVFGTTSVSASKAGEGQYWVNMIGNLSLRGVTRSQPVSAQVAVREDALRANGEFSIRLTDYGIQPVSFAGGTLKLKDELKLSFDLIGRRQER